ncbi:hypothetical protein NK356_20715 [Chryseobacterium sp. S0630]|uniref:hypothetical protein n=1 Tax=Chryseobacterium sp. S0630 TaxID=2957803 RepID=UPI0020A16E47|nr:hypothetical protein [Chryseobacterium sp. S0630]MCP1301607.1 hypothetical protein [Chryseobacterium sp. S0630]
MSSKTAIRILIILVLIYFLRTLIIYKPILSLFKTEQTKGVIINNKNFLRRGFLTGAFTYSYNFKINDKVYTNDSKNENVKIGDTVLVEYNETFPFINRIKDKK